MGKTATTTTTWLEMLENPHLHVPRPVGHYALMAVKSPPLHYYRYLYGTVGRDYVWVDRLRLSDRELADIIHDEAVELYVTYAEGAPAGYIELDFRPAPQAELAYFGLMPEFTGRGLGKFMLAQAIELAWEKPINRLFVHTCTMDHPAALPLYQKCGFVPYAQEETEVELPE